MIEHIENSKLTWPHLWNNLGLTKDHAGRWYASDKSPELVKTYCSQYPMPSHASPKRHAEPLLTVEFAKLLTEKMPKLAVKCGVAIETEDK